MMPRSRHTFSTCVQDLKRMMPTTRFLMMMCKTTYGFPAVDKTYCTSPSRPRTYDIRILRLAVVTHHTVL